MARKSVLVSYQQRNKILQIPESKEETDIEFLTGEFKRAFELGETFDIIVFQVFDKEWNEYIDLDGNSSLCNKDKIRVVLTPAVAQQTPTTGSASSIMPVSWLLIVVCHVIYGCIIITNERGCTGQLSHAYNISL